MKTKLLIAFLSVYITVSAQFSTGLKLNFSTGAIYSDNLKKNIDYRQYNDPKITEWSVTERWGIGFGFGGFAAFNFSDNFSILAEPTVDFMQCGIDLKRIDNKVDANGNGDITTQTTSSDINLIYFNLPLLARYAFGKSKFFIQGGVSFNFTGSPSIKSIGNSQKVNYTNGVIEKITTDPSYTLETRLNIFASPRINFVFGIGKSFDVGGRDLTLDLRYNLPMTKSDMFTTDGNYNDGVFKHNDLLGVDGKLDAEANAPYLLNDFKLHVVTLSISYALFKKTNSETKK